MASNHINAGIAANTEIKTHVEWKCESYADVEEVFFQLKHDRGKPAKDDGTYFWYELGSNVYMRRMGGVAKNLTWIDVILYDTPIVRFYPDDTFTVSNGGYNTRTTSRRVNQFTPDDHWFFHDKKILTTWIGDKKQQCQVHSNDSKLPIKKERTHDD